MSDVIKRYNNEVTREELVKAIEGSKTEGWQRDAKLAAESCLAAELGDLVAKYSASFTAFAPTGSFNTFYSKQNNRNQDTIKTQLKRKFEQSIKAAQSRHDDETDETVEHYTNLINNLNSMSPEQLDDLKRLHLS